MSELYQDPKKLKEQLARNKTGNWFQDQFTDMVSDGLSIGDDGRVKREGLAWWMQALTPGAEGIARTKQDIDENNIVRRIVRDSGLDDAAIIETAGDTKLTPDNAERIVNIARANYQTPAQKDEAAQRKKASDAQIKIAERTQSLAEQTAQDNRTYREIEQANRYRDKRESRLMLEKQDLRNNQTQQMNLQLGYARLAQEEKNRREDKKEKALLNLLSGLGNLGAAFAL